MILKTFNADSTGVLRHGNILKYCHISVVIHYNTNSEDFKLGMEEMEDKKELRGSTSDDPQKRLYEAILCLSNVDEVERFLCDLLSEKELLEATKRFHIAELLVAGKAQRKIEERVRKVWGEASTTTVGRVKKSLTGRSSYNGYALVLKKIHQAQNVSERSG